MNGSRRISDMSNYPAGSHLSFTVLRGAVDSVSLYEITDYELDQFEQGSPSSTLLNFAIFFFSVGASFLTILLTTDSLGVYTFLVFLVITILGISISFVLFVLWYKMSSKTKDICKKIRSRVPLPSSNQSNAVPETSSTIENTEENTNNPTAQTN